VDCVELCEETNGGCLTQVLSSACGAFWRIMARAHVCQNTTWLTIYWHLAHMACRIYRYIYAECIMEL